MTGGGGLKMKIPFAIGIKTVILMVDDVVPISVEGSSRMVENQMPVGSVVTFFFF